MADFILTAPWVQAPGSSGTVTPSRLHAQMRNLSPPSATKTVTKSVSSPQLKHAAQAAHQRMESDAMNTIPDPRSPTPRIHVTQNDSTESDIHPDLSQEVATLSTKLINAINHQTSLDDSLQQTRHELDNARDQLAKLNALVKAHEEKIAKGLLVEKVVYDKMEKQLMSELEEERKRRIDAEKAKRKTDNEVETLTAALFEEANVMVAAARKETEASEKRNDQLKQQLGDAQLLQVSMQEQLQDLKGVMEKMSAADDESNTLPTTTAPSTPGITPADKMSKLFDAVNLTPTTPGSDDINPDHPLHFTHLISPVLRSDLIPFREFQEMLKINSRSAPNSRVSSGNYGSLNVLGLGSLTNSSSSSLPLSKSPNSATNSPRESVASAGLPNLKDEKFYKRALSEDIEPTLRLDIAPGLSWMARRTVINSITAGSLVVEPNPPPPKFRGPVCACSLCGEARKDQKYARKFRFRTSDTEETRYPLCDWCLGRLRSTCDYIGFLRMVAAGHWRAETEDEKKAAWEEGVRLRERMFWMRIGGGVVPSFLPARESPRSPTFTNGKTDAARTSEESLMSEKALDSAVDMTDIPKEGAKSEDDPFQSKDDGAVKRVSIGKTVISNEVVPEKVLTDEEEKKIEAAAEAQLHEEVRKSLDVEAAKGGLRTPSHSRSASTPASPGLAPRKKDERLSLTIPGSFE